MPNYNRNMDEAPRDEHLLLLVPTRDPEAPVGVEMGSWDEEDNRWAGEWRYLDDNPEVGFKAYADNEPVAWASLPDIDDEILAEYETAPA